MNPAVTPQHGISITLPLPSHGVEISAYGLHTNGIAQKKRTHG